MNCHLDVILNIFEKTNVNKLSITLQKENELLKFNFEENIKINFDNEVEQDLVPISKLLINFKIPNESEMYQLHFTALDNIIKEACKNDNYSLNKINKFILEEYNKYINLEPIKFLKLLIFLLKKEIQTTIGNLYLNI
jgi:hypothetical protein